MSVRQRKINVRKRGRFALYEWEARGELRRATRAGTLMLMPVPGMVTLVAEGHALTRWGAMRKGKRALRRFCR